MGKDNVVYVQNGLLFNHEKEWTLSFAAQWMKPETIMLMKIDQMQGYKSLKTELKYSSFRIVEDTRT